MQVRFRIAAALAALIWLAPSAHAVDVDGKSFFDPKLYETDRHAVVITDLAHWSHPTKAVFQKYKLTLTRVELAWDRKFPIFHVASLAPDPSSSMNDHHFAPILYDLLKANANWPYKLVSDDFHDGFMIGWNRQDKAMQEELVENDGQ